MKTEEFISIPIRQRTVILLFIGQAEIEIVDLCMKSAILTALILGLVPSGLMASDVTESLRIGNEKVFATNLIVASLADGKGPPGGIRFSRTPQLNTLHYALDVEREKFGVRAAHYFNGIVEATGTALSVSNFFRALRMLQDDEFVISAQIGFIMGRMALSEQLKETNCVIRSAGADLGLLNITWLPKQTIENGGKLFAVPTGYVKIDSLGTNRPAAYACSYHSSDGTSNVLVSALFSTSPVPVQAIITGTECVIMSEKRLPDQQVQVPCAIVVRVE